MADLMYVHEKLGAAVLGMMQSTKPLQERLATACIFEVSRVWTGNASLPKEIQKQLANIKAEVNKISAVADEGTINATTQKMSDDEARAIIEKILMLYDDVHEAWAKEMGS